MWQESLIESRGAKVGRTRWLTFPLALLLHVLLMAITVLSSYSFVTPVAPPPIRVTFFSSTPPVSAVRLVSRKSSRKEMPLKSVPLFAQPTEIPQEILEPAEILDGVENLESEEPNVDFASAEDGIFEGGYPSGTFPGIPEGIVPLAGAEMGEAAPLRITAEMKRPKKILTLKPEYPSQAQKQRIEGIVVLKAVISERGSVEDIIVVQSLHPLLDRSALDAIRQWRYRPAYLQSRAVRVYLTVIVKFSLNRKAAEVW